MYSCFQEVVSVRIGGGGGYTYCAAQELGFGCCRYVVVLAYLLLQPLLTHVGLLAAVK